MAKQHDKQFKLDAVQYYQDHKDLGVRGCAENLGNFLDQELLTWWMTEENFHQVIDHSFSSHSFTL